MNKLISIIAVSLLLGSCSNIILPETCVVEIVNATDDLIQVQLGRQYEASNTTEYSYEYVSLPPNQTREIMVNVGNYVIISDNFDGRVNRINTLLDTDKTIVCYVDSIDLVGGDDDRTD
jgi:hypothetical protein